MGGEPSLHVVARDRITLVALLNEHLGRRVRVRQYPVLPSPRHLAPGDVLIVALENPDHQPTPRELLPFLDRHDVWLAYGNGSISAQWLEAAHWPHLHFVHCGEMNRAAGMQSLAASLVKQFIGPGSQEIAELVIDRERVLGQAEPLVRAVCEQPWAVRRPCQLASVSGIGFAAVKRQLKQLGFARVEHFITYVRWIAFEQLVAVHGLRPMVAQHLTGIADSSNQRRQVDRLRRGSPLALRRLAALACIVLTLGATACRAKAEGQPIREPGLLSSEQEKTLALPVAGAIVRGGDLILTVRTTGQVRAERQVSLRGEIQGTVQSVLIRAGDRVDSGQVLIRLDPRPFDLAVREAEAAVADATVRYRDILLGDDTLATAADAVERRRNARLRAGIDGAAATVERAQLDRERATLSAPFAATIDQVHVVVGQRLGPGDPIATLVDLGSLVVEASVLEHDLPQLRVGATASISLAAGRNESFEGRVVAILPLVDTTTRAGRVIVATRARNGLLRPGMYADVALEITRLTNRTIVPAQAVIERDGRPVVFRYTGGRADWVYVRIGSSNGRETEVVTDVTSQVRLSVGDTVVVEGQLTLVHEAPVRLIDAATKLNRP